MEFRDETAIRATVHYDGGSFHGSQAQPASRTVQGEIELCLFRLFESRPRVLFAGRTDSGVHATGQEIGFVAPAGWSSTELRRALNAVLPVDIWIEALGEADPEFHPRFSASGRRYEYYVATGEESGSPFRTARVWPVARGLSGDRLAECARLLPGSHSFAALSKTGKAGRGTRCSVEVARWDRVRGGELRFTIVADRFLHHMVRYLVAVMVDVACQRRPLEDLARLLVAEKARPPEPAPPQGLYLTGVRYGEDWNREPGVPGMREFTDT